MSVEGNPPRDQVVTFTKHFASYFPGESACFTADEAQALIEDGMAVRPGPPVNVDVPHVSQAGDFLNCTMGNWNGVPTAYAYQWKLDGTTDIGTDSPSYAVRPDDIGHTATCIVTATNDFGSTEAPPSDGVVIAPPSRQRPETGE
jgi:hypothetical protein